MEWYSREKKVLFEDESATAGEAAKASGELRRQLKDKTMVIHRKSVFGVSFRMMDRYVRVFIAAIILQGVVDTLNLGVIGTILRVILLLFLCAYIYRGMWEEGTMDKYFTLFSGLKKDRLRGLKVGSVSIIPFLAFDIVAFLAWKTQGQELFMVYQWLMLPFYSLIRFILPGGYVGDITGVKCFLLLCIPLLFVGVFVFGYWMGFEGKHILPQRNKIDIK